MAASTGCETLDGILNGGLPARRATLLTGGPGLGKSTLAMQFLQAGLDAGETCMYVTTEQTVDELESSFGDFDFELDHPNLTVASLHAGAGETVGPEETQLTLQTIEGEEIFGEGFSAPFEPQYIEKYLSRFGPCDRVVLDSVSGLSLLEEDPQHVRREVLDLIRLFTDEFEATTLFTAEESGDGVSRELTEALEFAMHGVISLEWQSVRGKDRRFLQISKMRGVDYDTREYELGIDEDGIYLTPQQWTHQFEFEDYRIVSTNVDGLDDLTGGGLVTGKPVLLEHDGRAPVDALVVSMAAGAFERDMGAWVVPSPVLDASRFEDLLPDETLSVPDLLDGGQLFVMDVFSAWDEYADHRNVYQISSSSWLTKLLSKRKLGLRFAKRVLKDIDRRRDRPVLAPTHTEAFLHLFEDVNQIRDLYYWALENVTVEEDTALYVHNPDTMDPQLAEFFSYDASQVFETWKHDSGIQYIRLDKSPTGSPGSMAVVEYRDTPPYVKVTQTVRE